MKEQTKHRLQGAALVYAVGALAFAAAGLKAIPCMTPLGAVYYGVLWPLSPISVATDTSLYPIADWACRAPDHD